MEANSTSMVEGSVLSKRDIWKKQGYSRPTQLVELMLIIGFCVSVMTVVFPR